MARDVWDREACSKGETSFHFEVNWSGAHLECSAAFSLQSGFVLMTHQSFYDHFNALIVEHLLPRHVASVNLVPGHILQPLFCDNEGVSTGFGLCIDARDALAVSA